MTETENNQPEAPATSSMIPGGRHDSELFRVYSRILDGITDHALLPGKKLTESDLCRQMVCSRNTVRGALSLLAHDKIVDLLPNRGAFVHVPDAKETRDVFETRIALEETVVNMLLDQNDESLSERLQPLYALVDEEEAAFARGDRVSWNRLANAFHIELARLLDNDVLLEMMHAVCARSSLIIAVFDKPKDRLRHTYCEHREILDLLAEGKRNRACKLMRRHLGECQARLLRKFEAESMEF
ncbi:GntR family transcriptional regulator [Neisseria animaloris]|uniref:GntR family transcriptional regulator n=1 Tax=Neisseria animaloris TaxID=326522 RepID=A0A1X3CMN0_9NEIS|nr:GntR family transcriptional regulator [Neisseria animaloris]OSI08788.1 GntR family transcriptional regulator [Neisseria animaloris]VEH87245.1 GntR family transcriptional regulator [Neisseria animaloris]VEJ20609.1 GntR family transcriptional regulator [Neisseria animaloris]